ncbi:MAG: hypothetical protein MJ069_04570 [Salinivirgaceae bacterium]|nr:hypothetical protein [Salinivirgaceae bacterium]
MNCPPLRGAAFYFSPAVLHNAQTQTSKTANAFSKAITEREVRKTDKYAAEINAIKGKLLDFINKGAEIKDSHFDKYNDIANKQVLHPFVKIVRAYIKINGKENVKKQANTICTNIANLCKVLPADFEFMAQLKAIEKSLNNYIEGKTATPKMLQTELSGLGRIADNDEDASTAYLVTLSRKEVYEDGYRDSETLLKSNDYNAAIAFFNDKKKQLQNMAEDDVCDYDLTMWVGDYEDIVEEEFADFIGEPTDGYAVLIKDSHGYLIENGDGKTERDFVLEDCKVKLVKKDELTDEIQISFGFPKRWVKLGLIPSRL